MAARTAPAAQYQYYGHADIKEFAFYIQDAITVHNWTFNLGLRVDKYNGITRAAQGEPRLGIAYNIKPTNTVLRVSYARTMETPFNENLVLASFGCNDPVIVAFQSFVAGAQCASQVPLSPGHRNEFHAGLSQAFGKYLVIDGEYIWKYTHKAFDFSVLGNTPITYPIEWASSKIPGYAIRATVPNFHGLTAFCGDVQRGGALLRSAGRRDRRRLPARVSVFRIDHDEIFNATTHLQYQPSKKAPWFSFNWRYDSGLVAGPVPCAGGNCANGPNGTDSIVDVSGLTPGSTVRRRTLLRERACDADHADQSDGPLPGEPVRFQPGDRFPPPGTEDDDHNPPRIAPRNLFDIAVGHDNIFHGDKYKWSARVTVVNLTNKEALYNFLSTFSGTHYVSPRAITATIGFHF